VNAIKAECCLMSGKKDARRVAEEKKEGKRREKGVDQALYFFLNVRELVKGEGNQAIT